MKGSPHYSLACPQYDTWWIDPCAGTADAVAGCWQIEFWRFCMGNAVRLTAPLVCRILGGCRGHS